MFVCAMHGYVKKLPIFSPGDTRLGLMWTCITLYNRPQVCFTPDLQPEWLLALVCIFVGCICITTTIILLASSHWDRNVVPYARWVGFTASKYKQAWNCLKSFNRCVIVTKIAYWCLFVHTHRQYSLSLT